MGKGIEPGETLIIKFKRGILPSLPKRRKP
jgi:hypothetical protein